MNFIKKLTPAQKKTDVDLWIIIITTLTALIIYLMNQDAIVSTFINQEMPVLIRTMYAASFQFGIAGLGITIVSIFRKESFLKYGLNTNNLFRTIVLSFFCITPYLIFIFVTKGNLQYMPFKTVYTMKELIQSPFPFNVIGISIIATVWGFFEGFNYIVISDKINTRYPTYNKRINLGALICSIIAILIHGSIGIQPENLIEMGTIIFMIYGLIVVREKTNNAWGIILVFMFFWNAL